MGRNSQDRRNYCLHEEQKEETPNHANITRDRRWNRCVRTCGGALEVKGVTVNLTAAPAWDDEPDHRRRLVDQVALPLNEHPRGVLTGRDCASSKATAHVADRVATDEPRDEPNHMGDIGVIRFALTKGYGFRRRRTRGDLSRALLQCVAIEELVERRPELVLFGQRQQELVRDNVIEGGT